MTLKIMARKLEMMNEKFITGDILREYCKKLGIDYYTSVRYLSSNKYLVRILRGIFYVKSIEERKLNKVNISHLQAVREALKIKKVVNWYFGLDTALRLNNLTHEYSVIIYVINDTLFRKNPIEILGHKVRFIKISAKLCSFGIKDNISDIEKTLLDIVYLGRYNGLSDDEIRSRIADLTGCCSFSKLASYSKKYPKTVRKMLEAFK